MILIVVSLNIKPEKMDEFEKAMADLSSKVRENEPNVKFYQLCKGKEAGEYCMVERYVNQAALDHHMKTQYFTAILQQVMPMLASELKMSTYIEI